jgi:hypothetical protein
MPEIGTSGSMSGDGKRSVAERPKLPRPSSTLPSATSRDVPCLLAIGGKADEGQAGQIDVHDPSLPLAAPIFCDAQHSFQCKMRWRATGAPLAALALMRSILEAVLRDHYGAKGRT